ncbi:MAG: hypothetical protein GF399_00645 [Candidatus Coatesbacteria bacterium]|nr:hypothetical protein [Candidatus Coatesbacteria bacterium]
MSNQRRLHLPAVATLFLLSGAAGLIFEVVWLRRMSFVFGATSQATATVLAAFMGGLALGSWLLGRAADRMKKPLRFYALLQLGVGVAGLLVPLLLALFQHLYVPLYSATGGGGFLYLTVRALLALLTLLPATTLMGATLPALARHVAAEKTSLGGRVGLLYALNTLGAVAGTFLSGFVLIEHLGLWGSSLLAAGLNLAAAGAALLLSRGEDVAVRPVERFKAPREKKARLLLILYAVSGFAALGLELVWTRTLILWFSNITYTFSAMLGIYLAGLALGGAIGSSLVKRLKNPGRAFAWLEVGVGLTALLSTGLALNWPGAMGDFSQSLVGGIAGWGSLVGSSIVLTIVVMLPPTILLGMLFPIVVRLYTSEVERAGERVGEIVAANGLGTILGSLLTGFVLIPLIGFQWSLYLLAALAVGVAAVAFAGFVERDRQRLYGWVGCAATLGLGALWLPFDKLGANFLRQGEVLLDYEETASGTIEVREQPDVIGTGGLPTRKLLIDGNQATYTAVADMRKNRLLAHLPMLVHPEPQRVLVICFGSGSTFGALALHDAVECVDCVEIAPGVLEMAPYFEAFNLDVLNHPQARVIIDDGRNYLLCTDQRYDVITAEPMHPALAGVVNLYTIEYYELCREALTDDGICTQWIPLYQVPVAEMRAMAASFAAAFPHIGLWLTGDDAVLLGSNQPLEPEMERFREAARDPAIVANLAEVGIDSPLRLAEALALDDAAFRAYVEGVRPVTDNDPFIEYTLPRAYRTAQTIRANTTVIGRYAGTGNR